jgi:hypothetical protein
MNEVCETSRARKSDKTLEIKRVVSLKEFEEQFKEIS